MSGLSVAMSAAERQVYGLHSESCEQRRRTHHLTKVGETAAGIGARISMSERNVVRLRCKPVPPEPLFLPDPKLISHERAAEFDLLAQRAFEWSGRLRDEDPVIVWEALRQLSRQELLEFAVVLLAMVPSEATLTELLGWVLDLPAARLGVES